MSRSTGRSGTSEETDDGRADDAGTHDGQDDDRRNDAHARIDPAEIGPAGALIAVAFTGALIGLIGAGLAFVVGDAALVLVVLGIAVVFASPVAYLRFRNVGPS